LKKTLLALIAILLLFVIASPATARQKIDI
jgi:hypothetical protein